ncbi:MAG: PEGA domain-containing protein [Myxococcales bacterium]|nr:PEGA domain-containing protein [Myxococcales bacterium]
MSSISTTHEPRRARRGGVLLALAVALCGLAVSSPARADDADQRKKEAQQHFDSALKLAESNDYAAALAEFRLAYGKFPSYRVLYNIAQLCARTDDAVCAHRAYTKYLRDGGADVPAKRRTATEAELDKLSKKVGLVTVTSSVAGASVKLDDEPLGETPLPDAVAVTPGSHKLKLVSGLKTADKAFDVGAGESTTAALEPADPAPASPKTAEPKADDKPTPAEDRPKDARPKRKVPWVPWAVAGGFAVGTGVLAVLTASSYGKYQDKKDSFPVSRGELDDAQGSAKTLFFVTGALGAATVVAAGVAGYFTWVAPQRAAIVVGPGTIGAVGTF